MWVADYVLLEYGTGAVMGVPAHDERDYEFAEQFGIEIRRVIECGIHLHRTGRCVNSGRFDGLNNREAYDQIIEWLESEGKGKSAVSYRLRDWLRRGSATGAARSRCSARRTASCRCRTTSRCGAARHRRLQAEGQSPLAPQRTG